MAKYTVELRTIMSDSVAGPLLQDALATYPLYTSDNPNVADIIPTREVLNTKLLNHYKYREIGFETVGRFLDELQITMNEIMPRYNELFKTVEIMAELPSPFDNVDVIEKYKETRTSTGNVSSSAQDESETTSNVNSNSKNVNSDMPQGNISVSANDIDSITRAKEVNWTKNNSNDSANTSGSSSSETNTEGSETVEHEYTKTGNQGVNTYAHDMNEFRTSIIDVTMQIIEDKRIAELFMMVY